MIATPNGNVEETLLIFLGTLCSGFHQVLPGSRLQVPTPKARWCRDVAPDLCMSASTCGWLVAAENWYRMVQIIRVGMCCFLHLDVADFG